MSRAWRTTAVTVLCVSAPLPIYGQSDSEVYLAPLLVRQGSIAVGVPANITQRPGYDNQPSFHRDGTLVYYTSQRNGQTDIYAYDRVNRVTNRVTDTPESEYSPQQIFDSDWLSVVRVEADSSQRLWRVTTTGDSLELLFPDLEPVGYYAWVDDTLVAAFILGNPPVLELAATSGESFTLARGVGRSIQPNAAHGAVSFTLADSLGNHTISLGLPSGTVTPLTPALPGSQDFAWAAADMILMARDSLLFQWRLGDEDWSPVAVEWGADRPGTITRLAVSSDRRWLALVGIP